MLGSSSKKAKRTFNLDEQKLGISVTQFFSEDDKMIDKYELRELIDIVRKE